MNAAQGSPIDQLRRRFARIQRFRDAQSVLEWDAQTMMPPGGAAGRAEQVAALATLCHELLTAPEVGDWLDAADAEAPADPWQAANLVEMRRTWRHATAVEPRLVEALSLAGHRCTNVWRQARRANDFATWAGPQAEVFRLVREVAAQKAAALGLSPYDALIDQFEPGMTAARIDEAFAPLRAELPPLIEEALEATRGRTHMPRPDGPFAEDDQKALGLQVMKAMGFDFDHGRLDVSSHPFCGGTPADVRMTTRYRSDVWLPSLMGIVHETGHALYEQGLPEALRDQPVGHARGMAAHESQSLFWEMQVARSPEFLQWLTPLAWKAFGGPSHLWHPDALMGEAHRVQRGLIRVDADECTYPGHVLLRFELEQALVAGRLGMDDLRDAWREGMRRFVGTEPDTDRDGCMQDIHWTDGAVGYFPSYTLGAMMAAQLAQALRRDLGERNWHFMLGRGEFQPLLDWLRTRVHQRASLVTSDGLVREATGSPLSARPLLDHLRRRYIDRSEGHPPA
jgi:carboxypeptidase Taq